MRKQDIEIVINAKGEVTFQVKGVKGGSCLDETKFLVGADGAPIVPIKLRFVGPYPYPRDITVNFWVDGGQWVSTKVACP